MIVINLMVNLAHKAVSNIKYVSEEESNWKELFNTQEEFDDLLIELDGTNNKKNIGANAILAASLAFEGKTEFDKIELFQSFGDSFSLPVPL